MSLLPFDLMDSLGISTKQATEAVKQFALAIKEFESIVQATEKTFDPITPLPTNSNKSSHAEGPLSIATGESAIAQNIINRIIPIQNIINRIIPIEEDDIL